MKVVIAPRTGLTLESPIMTASGTFGYGTEFAARMDLAGLGAIVCKGTTTEPRAGNQPPRLLETAAGMLNAVGLQNIGVRAVIQEQAPLWAQLRVPVFVNVSGTSVDDYRAIVETIDGVPGIAGVELNISCPNVKEGGVAFGTHPGPAAEVTTAVRAATQLPLIVKLSPNVDDIRAIAASVEAAGADAVSVANTLFGMAIDVRSRGPALAPITGGLSGPAIKPYVLYLVYQVAQEVAIPVIGVGGILTADDALQYVMAGATAVQLGTALLVDPTAWRRVGNDLQAWCEREGVSDLDTVVGAANPGYKRKTGEKLAG